MTPQETAANAYRFACQFFAENTLADPARVQITQRICNAIKAAHPESGCRAVYGKVEQKGKTMPHWWCVLANGERVDPIGEACNPPLSNHHVVCDNAENVMNNIIKLDKLAHELTLQGMAGEKIAAIGQEVMTAKAHGLTQRELVNHLKRKFGTV